jgi:D-proline reductase (dithiol) PrdB
MMVRITDLPDYEREHLLGKNLSPLGSQPWTKHDKPLEQMRIALITTAGLHFRDDESFDFTDSTFRPIAGEENANNLIMSHSSVNFDRSGFAEDVNLVFPIDRFRELAAQNSIGSLADVHYSFMGAGLLPEAYEQSTAQVAGLLKQDQVDAVFLTPV